LRKKISDWEKSEIVDLHLQGLTRDEIAKKTGISAGGVSGVIKEFTDCADSESLDEAAEQYDVVETAEGLRSLAIEIRRAGTSVEGLMEVSKMLERIKKLVTLDRLEDFIKAGESLKDRAHVEASVRMHSIEELTGRFHDEILSDLQSKEAKVRELSTEVQRLQSQIKSLDAGREKAQADFNSEKARLEAELEDRLKQHSLTLQRIDDISKIERELSDYGIELTQLEGLRRVLSAVEEAGQDAEKIVELAKKASSLKAQAEAEAKELAETRELVAKLNETVSTLEERLAGAESVVERCRELESMGWNRERLERVLKLAGEAGSPEEVLSRLELLKPSAEVKAELERTKAETEELKEKDLKMIEEASKTLSTLVTESSSLVNEKIPGIVAEVSDVMKTQIISLAKEYNNLAEKYSKLQADFNRLAEEYRRYQKGLDDAIGWTTLINEPEKLPSDTVAHIFFNVMLPKMEAWCKNKTAEERYNIARELAKRAMCLYTEPAANFVKAPEKANVTDAMLTLISFATATMPFYTAFSKWYALHKHEKEASNLYDVHYHLEKFYKEGILTKLRGSNNA